MTPKTVRGNPTPGFNPIQQSTAIQDQLTEGSILVAFSLGSFLSKSNWAGSTGPGFVGVDTAYRSINIKQRKVSRYTCRELPSNETPQHCFSAHLNNTIYRLEKHSGRIKLQHGCFRQISPVAIASPGDN